MADACVPLCSEVQFRASAYADLAEGYDSAALGVILLEATRLCEEECSRRLAPFTVTETLRATGIDPDEYPESADIPMDIQGTLGMSYASALGGASLARHVWLHEFPPRYPEMWAYSGVSVTVIRSYGGTQVLQPGQILSGPDDTGHIRFTLGTFLPVGSGVRVAYSGGYQTYPGSLVRAGKFMGAYLIVRELNPEDTSHDPDLLREDAATIMASWGRE